MKRLAIFIILLLPNAVVCWAEKYPVAGMVLKVDQSHKILVVSCQSIPGYMDAMVMPLKVQKVSDLDGLTPGVEVNFIMVVEKESIYAEHLQIRQYESVEQDPLAARRLKLLDQLSHAGATSARVLAIGERVPNFTLIDQNRHRVTLSQFSGKVVAINFIYTSCALPNFCFRSSNNFGVLQKRFKERMGKELVLLTVTFDPRRDQPDVLARYARTWKADPATWHFLTGSVPDIQHVTSLFGVDYFPNEGLMNHSLHTAIVDRQRRLVANIEGNRFTVDQLGDLAQTVLTHNSGGKRANQR